MPQSRGNGAVPLLIFLTVVVVVGSPLFAYLWETLNQVLSGHFPVGRIAVTVPILLAFVALLWFAARGFARVAPPGPADMARAPEAAPEEPVVTGTLLLTSVILIFVFGTWIILYLVLLSR